MAYMGLETSRAGDGERLAFLPPDDVLFLIFSFCDSASLANLARACRRFRGIVNQDCLWRRRSRVALVTNQKTEEIRRRSCQILSPKDKCRVSHNWKCASNYSCDCLVKYNTRYMPWLQLSSDKLWYSKGNIILCHSHLRSGGIERKPTYTLKAHIDDVCRFVHRHGLIVSGGRDGSLCGWYADSGRFLFYKKFCHNSDINSVDAYENVIVSGSRDKTAQVWLLQNQSLTNRLVLNAQDRVWSVAINPNGSNFAVGTAGYHEVLPLQLYSLETGALLKLLGTNYRNGAGVLDICYDSPSVLLSAGYDTYIRMWDTRVGKCVLEWEDPHDSAVYSLASDHNFTVLSGTARHGLVRLWDKRSTKSIQMYYVGQDNSPVYSVTFDPCHMYVALDQSVNLLNFRKSY